MSFEKIKIKYNFNKACKTYDRHCDVQNKICEKTIQLLLNHKNYFETAGDFACGTGESTKQLVSSIQYKKCYGIDFSENLLNNAKNKLSDVEFILSDFDDSVFEDESLDLIFSNMGLQWSIDLQKTFFVFNHYLKKDGLIAFSLPVDGNFQEIHAQNKIATLTHESISELLEKLNLKIIQFENLTYTEEFSDQITALRSIKNVGARLVKSHGFKVGLSRSHIKNIFLTEKTTTLTYKIGIYIVGQI